MEFDSKTKETVNKLRKEGQSWSAIARELGKQGVKRGTGKPYTGQEILRKMGPTKVTKRKQRAVKPTKNNTITDMIGLIELVIASNAKDKSQLVGAIVRSFS